MCYLFPVEVRKEHQTVVPKLRHNPPPRHAERPPESSQVQNTKARLTSFQVAGSSLLHAMQYSPVSHLGLTYAGKNRKPSSLIVNRAGFDRYRVWTTSAYAPPPLSNY